jgi:hypothetical protein
MSEDDHTTHVEYRAVPGFSGYKVGDDGCVWSCHHRSGRSGLGGIWRPLKPKRQRNGYLVVCLRRDGREYTRFIHRLVLEAFIGPCPTGMEACHAPDPNKTNNRLGNLRWDTRAANCADWILHRRDFTSIFGSDNGQAKLVEGDIPRIRTLHATGLSQREIARRFGVSQPRISAILNGKAWTHVN